MVVEGRRPWAGAAVPLLVVAYSEPTAPLRGLGAAAGGGGAGRRGSRQALWYRPRPMVTPTRPTTAPATPPPEASARVAESAGPARPAWTAAVLVRVGLLTAATMTVLDQATKVLVTRLLSPGRSVALLGEHVGWQLTFNEGGAFGLPAPSWFFLVVTVVVAVIVGRNLPVVPGPGQAVAYGLLLAGALGNALDRVLRTGDPGDPRFLHGHVVDFVAWGAWPRFNVADASITVGFVLLVVVLWLDEREAVDAGGVSGADRRPRSR